MLKNPHFELPLTSYFGLLEAASEKIDPSIGLRIAQDAKRERTSLFGALGHAAGSADTARGFLDCLSTYLVVWGQGIEMNWEVQDDQLHLHYQVTDPVVIHRRQDTELTVAAIFFCLCRLTGRDLQPLRVEFEHPQPADISLHRETFGCPLRFDTPTNTLMLPAETLDYPLSSANARLHQALLPALDEQRKERTASSDLPSRINQAIASNLGGGINLDRVAQSMNMSSRTLQRRLQSMNLEFHALVEEIRRNLALDHVGNSERPITEIAMLLGYTETSSFTRAFRRWTQMPPKQYRQQTLQRMAG
ncbi:HTH-type transcriptional regulator VirS [compost metagenome]